MSRFERYLTLWVAACIVVGITLGQLFPAVFQIIGGAQVAQPRPDVVDLFDVVLGGRLPPLLLCRRSRCVTQRR